MSNGHKGAERVSYDVGDQKIGIHNWPLKVPRPFGVSQIVLSVFCSVFVVSETTFLKKNDRFVSHFLPEG